MSVHNDGVGATGRFPQGKIHESDEGELQFAIGTDLSNKVVMLYFGKAVAWLGLPKKEALELAEGIKKKASELPE